MRIAGPSFTNSLTTQINSLSALQYQLENEASTGQSIQNPSDNPAGMEQALDLQAENSTTGQYSQNITNLQSQATLVGNALSQLQTIATKVSEIATESTSLSSTSELQANAAQTTQLIQQAVQIMNTKDGDSYIFGGTDGSQPPFTVATDSNGNVTGVTYQGNTSVTENEIGQNSTITVGIPGENNTGSGARGIISDSTSGADFFNDMISLQNNLLSGNTSAITSTVQPALTNDENNIIYQVGANAAVQSRLQVASSAASTQQDALNTDLTNVAGADLTTTLTQLTQAQNAYQIAMQSSSTIMQLQTSLLAYLP